MFGKSLEWVFRSRSQPPPYLCIYLSGIEYARTNLQDKLEKKNTEFEYISFLELNMYTKTEVQAT